MGGRIKMDNTQNNVISLLDASGKSDAEIEKDLHLPRSTVYDWRNGRSKSYKKYISEIAAYFNVTTDYLLGNAPQEPAADQPTDLERILEKESTLAFHGTPLNDDDRAKVLKAIKFAMDLENKK